MAYRALNKNNVFRGRTSKVRFEATGSEVIALQDIKDGTVVINEEIKESTYEMVDSQEIIEDQGRKIVVEFTYDEVVPTDISKIHGCDYIEVVTTQGGNGAGLTFYVSGSDNCKAFVEDFKTKVIVTKTAASGLPYSSSIN